MPERVYTKEEARLIFLYEICLAQGHDWAEVRDGAGTTIRLYCERGCRATATVNNPEMPSGRWETIKQ